MRLLSYRHGGRDSFGLLREDGSIIDGPALCSGRFASLLELLRADGLELLREALSGSTPDPLDLDQVELHKPIEAPGRIVCVGLNYRSHVEELGWEMPRYPALFTRFADSLVASGTPLVRPVCSTRLDFEGELAVIIGRSARHVPTAEALQFVAGYTLFNDGSVRDFQGHSSQFTAGKNFYQSGAMGPWMVTTDALGDGSGLQLQTRLNGELMQNANTDDLIFSVPELIAYISQIMPLQPGDVIATGTPGGVGFLRKPRRYLQPGDRVEVEIGGIGILVNPVMDEVAASA